MTLPAPGAKLNNPSHSKLHRILNIDVAAPEQSLVIDSFGSLNIITDKNGSVISDKNGDVITK